MGRAGVSMPALVIRHARTDWNDLGLWQGAEVDRPLTADGERDARNLAGEVQRLFASKPVVFSSPSRRALATARLLIPGCLPVVLPGLQELSGGDISGLDYAKVRARHPDFADDWWSGKLATPPGGESVAEIVERVRQALVRCDEASSPWLAVTHLGVINAVEEIHKVEDSSLVANLQGVLRTDGVWTRWKGSNGHSS